MRKVLIALLATVLVAVGATGGGASARADSQGADWLAAGTGTLVVPAQFGVPMLHVNAQSNFGGTNVRGHFWIRYANGGGEFGGPIVCLNVVGQFAYLYGRIDTVKTPRKGFDLSSYVPIRLVDGGDPGTTFDGANFDVGGPGVPPQCTQNGGYQNISQGNYVVHDQPLTDPLQLDLLNQFLAQSESAANDPYG
jgi:hypothetical protein